MPQVAQDLLMSLGIAVVVMALLGYLSHRVVGWIYPSYPDAAEGR